MYNDNSTLLDSTHYFKGVNVKIVGIPKFSYSANVNLHYYIMKERFETIILDLNSEILKSWNIGANNLPYSKVVSEDLLAKKRLWNYFTSNFLKESGLILDPIEPYVFESYKKSLMNYA